MIVLCDSERIRGFQGEKDANQSSPSASYQPEGMMKKMTILYPPRTARSSTRNASMVSAASTPSGNKREE